MALFYARTGIIGAVMLGFGRALGETMAVTMVIGNTPQISASLYAPQYTMAAVIANEFTEAADDLHLHALVEIGLVLFIITLIINVISRAFIWSLGRRIRRPRRVAKASAQPARRPPDAQPLADASCRTRSWRSLRGAVLAGARAAGVRALLRRARRASRRSTWAFFTHMPVPVGRNGRRHGERHRRVADRDGLGALFAIPIGVIAGVYAAEYRGTRLADAMRFAADTLNGVPSIVIGVFAYGMAVLPFHQFSALAGGVRARDHDAAARHADDRGAAAPGAALAAGGGAGARRDARARGVHGRACRPRCPGILTGILLALARVAGETAPLLFTALNNRYFTPTSASRSRR